MHTQCTFISTASLYGLAIHTTRCVFNNFPLFSSLSTPNSMYHSAHSTHHRPWLNPSQSFMILQLSNNIISIHDPYQLCNNTFFFSMYNIWRGANTMNNLPLHLQVPWLAQLFVGYFLSSPMLCVMWHVMLSLSTLLLPDLHIYQLAQEEPQPFYMLVKPCIHPGQHSTLPQGLPDGLILSTTAQPHPPSHLHSILLQANTDDDTPFRGCSSYVTPGNISFAHFTHGTLT